MKRSKHSLSYTQLLTTKMGLLTPCGITEVLPGDTFQHATSALVRCAPLNAPVMHPIHVRIHHWFVPYRLLWVNWEDFITGDPAGSSPVFPYINLGATASALGTLADYFGIGTLTGGHSLHVSALPFRAYTLIFNEWYRDQDLSGSLTVTTADGADTTTNLSPQQCCWEKDYFTTCRPWTQKGPAVTLPIGSTAPVRGIGVATQNFPTSAVGPIYESNGASRTYASAKEIDPSSSDKQVYMEGTAATGGYPTIFADLASATGTSVNALRQALAIQRYEEARARYGSRYTEYLRYLGVRSSDARLQRPEYLGGGRQTIQFSEVLQTSNTTSGTPATGVGSYGGHGIGATRSNRYRRFFEEHGIVMSLLSVLPKTIYGNACPRLFFRTALTDFWQKELEHIGQQEVFLEEVFSDTGAGGTYTLFGYQDRYDEYRRQESVISGQFRTTFNYWHDARIFASAPALNGSFVTAVPSTRIFQDTSDDNLYVMTMHSLQARRLVAKIGTSSIF